MSATDAGKSYALGDKMRDEILGHILKALDHIDSAMALVGREESIDVGLAGVHVSLQDIFDVIDDARNEKKEPTHDPR